MLHSFPDRTKALFQKVFHIEINYDDRKLQKAVLLINK